MKHWVGVQNFFDKVFIFEGITIEEACQNARGCTATLKSDPIKMGMMRVSSDSKYFVSTLTDTYDAYGDAKGEEAAGTIGDVANVVTVVCPKCAPVTIPISAIASAAKFYFEPSLENFVVPLAGQVGGRLISRSSKLNPNQAAAGGAGIELGAGLVADPPDRKD